MASKRRPSKSPKRRSAKTASAQFPRSTQEARALVQQTWEHTLASLTDTQTQVEKQLRQLLKRNRIDASGAGPLFASLNAAFERERKQVVKRLETHARRLQGRLDQERKGLGKRVDGAVQSALDSLNIPSRRELTELGRKVELLTRKIDRLQRA